MDLNADNWCARCGRRTTRRHGDGWVHTDTRQHECPPPSEDPAT